MGGGGEDEGHADGEDGCAGSRLYLQHPPGRRYTRKSPSSYSMVSLGRSSMGLTQWEVIYTDIYSKVPLMNRVMRLKAQLRCLCLFAGALVVCSTCRSPVALLM